LAHKKPAAVGGGFENVNRASVGRANARAAHFCHVRFLWRFAFKRFLRLCLFIFRRRFFFRLPMVIASW
jgi:hypothetical protein